MRIGGILGWVLTCIGGLALGIVGFNLLGGSGDGEADPPPEQPPIAEVDAAPSEFAREAVPPRLLNLYVRIGDELGLDWSVIAAVDQTEGRSGPAEDAERVGAIAYSLEALGAPHDYRIAVEAHGGSARYARTVLRLADRYRDVGLADPPRASGKLRMPARGPVIAAYGRRLGILHDGIDIDAPTGRPIHAAAAGLVVSTGMHTVFGQYTCLLHRFAPPLNGERRITTCYGNQSRYATEPGAVVERGEVIGYVGCTGTCLRPGVHFQVRRGTGPTAPVTDPAPFLADPGRIGRGRPLEVPVRPPER
jgi:murein DD-endopeptidase MepM/ murein hydrolase activator NlpD